MASTPDTLTPTQLKLARIALWHQDGDALRTLDDAREWLDAAGLVSYYPHAQFAAAPQPSFAEAILGRPENGWIPQAATAPDGSSEESFIFDVEAMEPGDEAGKPVRRDFDEDEDDLDADDLDDDAADEEGDSEEAKGWSPEAADAEVMLTNGDEIAEDEGDEIAEEDRIHAGGGPTSNEVTEDAPAAEPAPEPINGFTADEKEVVSRTLARMIAEGSAVPLNLLGGSTGEPDFICSAQAFSFVYTLRGDKNFKNEPAQTGSMRVSPLAVKVFALLKDKGAMAPHELAAELAQGVNDAAVLRALTELWSIQRVIPVPDVDGAPAKWELLTGRFVRHLKAGANAGQPTALSALLSLYLSQAVAATSDEMETFLSPLAARSRVREVVGGLSASRQLESTVLDGKALLYLPGALDDLPADVTAPAEFVAVPRSRYEDDDRRAMIAERNDRFAAEGGAPTRRPSFGDRKPGFGDRKPGYPVRRPAAAREGGERPARAGSGGQRREGGFGGRREGGFTPQRRSGFAGGAGERERRPFTRPAEDGTSDTPRNEFARPWDDEQRSSSAREGGERKPFTPRDGGDRKPYAPREGSRRPFTPREGGDRPGFGARRPFTPREGGERRPFTPREGGDRPGFGARRPFTPREGGERRPFTPREGGDRPFTPRRDGERRPFVPREGGRGGFGGRKPFVPREGGGDRPFTPRGDGERRPFTPREGGDRRPFTPRGDRPFTPREGGGERRPFAPRGDRPFTPRGDRPFTPREGGERRPFAPREGGRGFGDRKPFTPREGGGDRRPFTPRGDRPFTPRGDRPFTPRGDRPFTPREGGERRPFVPREGAEGRSFKSSGPGGAKFGGSGFGRDRGGAPGGFGKPGARPPRRGPGNGPGRGGAPKRRSE